MMYRATEANEFSDVDLLNMVRADVSSITPKLRICVVKRVLVLYYDLGGSRTGLAIRHSRNRSKCPKTNRANKLTRMEIRQEQSRQATNIDVKERFDKYVPTVGPATRCATPARVSYGSKSYESR
jgi:hypothetical protein